MKASRKRRFQPSEGSIREDEAANTAKASPRKVCTDTPQACTACSQAQQGQMSDASVTLADKLSGVGRQRRPLVR